MNSHNQAGQSILQANQLLLEHCIEDLQHPLAAFAVPSPLSKRPAVVEDCKTLVLPSSVT